jgi:hypothetical protein
VQATKGARHRVEKRRASSELDLTNIIVSYNTCRQTLECIRSVRNSTFATSYEIIVVDNASTDGSVKELERPFRMLTLLPPAKTSVSLALTILQNSTLGDDGFFC